MRLPLQLGIAALASLARAAAFLLPGLVLTGIALGFFFQLPDLGDTIGEILFMVIAGPPIALLAFAWRHLKRARVQRPSDLILNPDGFTVEGGPLHGTRVAWAEVKTCTLEPPKEKDDDDLSAGLHRVCLHRKKGGPLWLAATDHEVERASLEEVVRTLAARQVQPEQRDLPPEVLTCRTCHAPVPPTPEPSARCSFCGTVNEMPKELRERLAAQARVDARDARAVARLLDQPGATSVGRVFAFGGAVMLASWPIAATVLWINAAHDLWSWRAAFAVLVFVAGSILGFFTFVRGRLVDRQALALLTVRFCARASGPEGKTLVCRNCRAPLPPGPPRTLVSCAYCQAPNVLAVDFNAQARAVDAEAKSLSRALQRRSAERRRWRGATVVGVLLIAGAAWALRTGIARHPRAAACEAGDAAACVELGRWYGTRDPARAEALLRAQCDAGVADGCAALGELWLDPLFLPPDHGPRPVAEVLDRACTLGAGRSCERLGELYEKGDWLRHVDADLSRAATAYERGCSLGAGEACTNWGYALSKGRGVAADEARAATVYQRACSLGNAMGCNNLGSLYENGNGVPADPRRAAELYAQACDAGVSLGCRNASSLAAQTP
ncbi:MAG: sel1 repeat family protein [Myxococcaceae bacterium]|nr:sel1 repeat family protein [Myxococcaceae bacterium]